MLKLIFLDVDGVLNSQYYLSLNSTQKNFTEVKGDKQKGRLEWDKIWFDSERVFMLNEITNKTGAKIVVSSSWRKTRTIEQLQILFSEVGITGEIVGKTDVLKFSNYNMSVPRGIEIKKWLEDNKGILGINLQAYKSYVIIDDDSDMLYWHRRNFFQTDNYIGLTPNLTYKIINFLK